MIHRRGSIRVYQSPARLLSIGAMTLLSVQRCMLHISSHLSIYLYIYEPEVGIPSAKLLNFLYVLIRETSKPMSKTRGSIRDYVLDSGPLIYLLFWDQQQTDASSAVDATDPSLDSCHCYSTSCVTACGAFPRGVRPPGTLSVLSKERGSLRVRYAEDERGPNP